MTERNPYSRYNYDTYDQAPRGVDPRIGFAERVQAKMRTPLFAGTALALTVAALAGIIIASYPHGGSEPSVPVIQADAGPIREAAPEGGGVEVANQDSTVFTSIHPAAGGSDETAPVENLAAEKEQPVNKMEAFAKEAENMFDDDHASPTAITEHVAVTTAPPGQPANDNTGKATGEKTASTTSAVIPLMAATATKPVIISETEEKIPLVAAAATPPATSATPGIARPAGSSPETLAFVRSVLDKKDGKTAGTAEAVNTKAAATQTATPQVIEPAAGASATTSAAIVPGNYYVQLSSVTNETAAPAEWKRLQKAYASSLQNISYRVQRVDLGEKGTRFRIQAGPMTHDTALNSCTSIKVQKPGGCLVVQ